MGTTFRSLGLSTLEGILSKCVLEGDCILYTGRKDRDGYGVCSVDQAPRRVHRLIYEATGSSIPQGLTIDHLCRVRHCVNPSHMEPVTNRENILRGTSPVAVNARKTQCPRGHEYDGTDRTSTGRCRTCSKCQALNQRAYRARKAAA